MEDAHSMMVLDDETGALFVGIFDGHNGAECSVNAARSMEAVLKKEPRPITEQRVTEIVVDIDRKYIAANGTDGSTGVFVIMTPAEGGFALQVANIGDSRAMLWSAESKQCVSLTEDHKPTNPRERARIEAAGIHVENGRVNGDLAVARAFGDCQYKSASLTPERQAVTVCPEFAYHTMREGDFLLVACDGVFESNVFTNEQVTAYAAGQLAETSDVAIASCRVVDEAMRRGSKDNISCNIVWYKPNHAPPGKGKKQCLPGAFLPIPSNDQYREAFNKMCIRGDISLAAAVMMRHDMLRALMGQTPPDPSWPPFWKLITETLDSDGGLAELEAMGKVPTALQGPARIQYFEQIVAPRNKR